MFSRGIIILVYSPLGSFLWAHIFLCHVQNKTQYSSQSHSVIDRVEKSYNMSRSLCVHDICNFLSVIILLRQVQLANHYNLPTSDYFLFEELLTI